MNGHLQRRENTTEGLREQELQNLDPILFSVRERALKLQRTMPGNRQLLNALCMDEEPSRMRV